jgi:hypothetical protein
MPILAALAVVAFARPAAADDDAYIEQVVLVDAASIGLLVGVRDTPAVGIVSYALLAPNVHLAHGQGDRVVASLAMRAVPVLSVVTLGGCGGGESALGCGLGNVFLGVAAALAVTAIDAFVVADGDAPPAAMALARGRF